MSTEIETKIFLNKFVLRPYQRPIFDAIENKGYKRVLAVWPRRAGKDIVSWNLIIRQAIRKLAVYYYIFPTYSQAKKVIWDSITNEGIRFRDYIPSSLVQSSNSQEMKIFLTNGSLIQLIGSDNIDSVIGTNPIGCVFSEYAIQDPKAYQFLRPILVANDGWAIFESTPRGRQNHLYALYQIALESPDWFCYKLTLDDTNHISRHQIEKEKAEGLMSEDLIMQEYYTSFDLGIEGAYYSRYLDKMRLNGQITIVPWEPSFKVHTAWDLGIRDATSIIFFQTIGTTVRIIDCYENTSQGLEFYAKHLSSLPYDYGKHFAPHDISVRELGTGVSRLEKARQLGIRFNIAPKLSLEDGIEACRSTFAKVWLDETKCQPLLKALESYRQEYDSKRRIYKGKPLHDSSSNFCFIGDTKVKTNCGDKCIRDIKIGDYVITPKGIRKVLKTHVRIANKTNIVRTNRESIECTSGHEFFTNKGVVKCVALRYNDVLENYSKLRIYLWRKIFGFYGVGLDLKGFKKTILSLKMKNRPCLMATFIHGMTDTTVEEMGVKEYQQFSAPFGLTIKGKFLMVMLSTIRIIIPRTILSKILSFSKKVNTWHTMPGYLGLGLIHKNAKNCLNLMRSKLKNGTLRQKVSLGIKNMLITVCLFFKVKNIRRHVLFVKKNLMERWPGKNIAVINVKQRKELLTEWILKGVIVAYVKIYSLVINTLLRRHVVKSVQTKLHQKPKEVFDLTVDIDNCYYANGYLVSNCDAYRYLCLSLPKTRDGLSAEQIEKNYQEAMYGTQQLPGFFRDDYPKY